MAGTSVGIDSSRGTREVDFDVCIVDEGSKAPPTDRTPRALSKGKAVDSGGR
jgi:hypothetical protein